MDAFRKNKYIFSNIRTISEKDEEFIEERKKQISLLLKELFLYKVLTKDLIAKRPKENEKNLILNISYYIVENEELLEEFNNKRILHINKLSKITHIPSSFFDIWQDYIIAYIIILHNPNYKLIQDYLKIEYADKNSEMIEGNNADHYLGMVLEVKKKHIIIMTSNGEFIKLKKDDTAIVGEEVSGGEKIGIRHLKLKIAIGVLIILFMAVGAYKDYNNTVSTIVLKTTSDIKIQINRYNNVVYTYAESEKGKDMLKQVSGMDEDIDIVMKKCIKYAYENDMIPKEGLSMTVIGKRLDYGSLEKTGNYIVDNDIKLLINNAGVQHKLSQSILNERDED